MEGLLREGLHIINKIPIDEMQFIDGVISQEKERDIKRYDFNLRLSVNLTYEFDDYSAEEMFDKVKKLQADQVTFRVLYKSLGGDTPQDQWIENHGACDMTIALIKGYIKNTVHH